MTDDLISRQAAVEALGEEPEVWSGKDEYEMGLNNQWHYDRNAIMEVPTADAPERNVGEWIITEYHSNYADWDDYTCPFCRKTFSRIYGARFCPSCGARLFDKDTNVHGKGESDAKV